MITVPTMGAVAAAQRAAEEAGSPLSVLPNLRYWVRADSVTLDPGDPSLVQEWPKLAGAATQNLINTVGNKPLVSTAGGFPSVRFWTGGADTSGTYRLLGNVALNHYLATTGYHVFIVFYPEVVVTNNGTIYSNHRLFGESGGWWGLYLRNVGGTTPTLYLYHWDTSAKSVSVACPTGQLHIAEAWFNGSSINLRLNGGAPVSLTVGNSGNMAPNVSIGVATSGANANYRGHVLELACANAHSAGSDEITAIRAGLADYYGVSL